MNQVCNIRRLLVATGVFLLACHSSWADSRCAIRGFVTDLLGNPLVGATVKLSGASVQRVTTDSGGEYRLEALVADKPSLSASYPGFERGHETLTSCADRAVPVIVNFGLVAGRLADLAPFPFEGDVVDGRGHPVVDAVVTIANPFNGGLTLSVLTNEKGRFRADIPNPGQYIVRAHRPGYRVAARTVLAPAGLSRQVVRVSLTLARLPAP